MPELPLFRRWGPSQAKAVLLLVYGLGAHTGRWEWLANFFAQKGYASYAIELRGFGETKDLPRGHVDSLKIYYRDIRQLATLIRKENPGKKIFVLGESLGGLLAYMTAHLYPEHFAGLIAISPYFKSSLKLPLYEYPLIFLSLLYHPRKLFHIPFNAAMLTRDPEEQKAVESDPRELRLSSSGLLFMILVEQLRAKRLAKSIGLPTLFLLSGKDLLVDPGTSKAILKKIKIADKTLIEYPEMLHALSIELGREKVFNDILGWLEGRKTCRPPKAHF
jgi:alpha-beta hydrolase superfamily lysophospholipase